MLSLQPYSASQSTHCAAGDTSLRCTLKIRHAIRRGRCDRLDWDVDWHLRSCSSLDRASREPEAAEGSVLIPRIAALDAHALPPTILCVTINELRRETQASAAHRRCAIPCRVSDAIALNRTSTSIFGLVRAFTVRAQSQKQQKLSAHSAHRTVRSA